MARFTFKLPDIGEGIAEAEIVGWHVAVGDEIGDDAPLADMLTDKATVEIESPVAGVVVELAGAVGDKVAIGAMLAVIEVAGEGDAPAETATPAEPVVAKLDAVPDTSAPLAAAAAPPAKPEPAEFSPAGAPVLASPAVRARAKALGVDLAQVRHDGPHIRHADLDAFLKYNAHQGYAAAGATRPDETHPVIGLRRRIAENMAAAKRHIPHFTYVEEVEATALEATRGQLNSQEADRPRLSPLPFIAMALIRALAQYPMLNARYDDGEANVVTRHGAVHLGIATQTSAGLMVPVVRNAEALNIWQLAGEIARLAAAAREGTAARDELTGSTITITSLGALGGVASTPVINRPEVAILGVGRLIERPVFVDANSDRIRRASLMTLSMSCDHRVVDGHDAASCVAQIKRLIEAPALLLAE